MDLNKYYQVLILMYNIALAAVCVGCYYCFIILTLDASITTSLAVLVFWGISSFIIAFVLYVDYLYFYNRKRFIELFPRKRTNNGGERLRKKEAIKKVIEVVRRTNVNAWYGKNMENKPQANTVNQLLSGITEGDLTIEEALNIALLVGIQWNEKF